MSKWSVGAFFRQPFPVILAGYGLSRGGYCGNGVAGRTWYLYLPLVVLTLKQEWAIR